MRKLSALLCITAILSLSSTTFAQTNLPKAGAATGQDSDGNVFKKVTTHDFEVDNVEGGVIRPDELGVTGEQHNKTSSLINIRANFVPELVKSAQNI